MVQKMLFPGTFEIAHESSQRTRTHDGRSSASDIGAHAKFFVRHLLVTAICRNANDTLYERNVAVSQLGLVGSIVLVRR